MSKNIKYTAAIIGTGRIGFSLGFDKKREQPASHTSALLANKRINLIAGCDNNPEHLANWQKIVKCAGAYDNFPYLFAACKPDIVVIAVNEDAHLETSLAAIRTRPRIIILEKPVALNMHDAELIAEESLDYGVPILVNHERRFADDYKAAKKLLPEIGNIQSVNARLDSGLRVYAPEFEESGEYSLLHDGTHLVDCVIYLLENTDSDKKDFTDSAFYANVPPI
ncbi:MAG: Gfo/Idh/MocA family protein, partial [Treponema sp.]